MGEDEIDLIGDQGGNQILWRADADMETHVQVFRLESRDRGRQQLARNRLNSGDADLAAHQTAQLLDLRFDGLEF
jgi:hypothetical protein